MIELRGVCVYISLPLWGEGGRAGGRMGLHTRTLGEGENGSLEIS